jgi:hypothetical protein
VGIDLTVIPLQDLSRLSICGPPVRVSLDVYLTIARLALRVDPQRPFHRWRPLNIRRRHGNPPFPEFRLVFRPQQDRPALGPSCPQTPSDAARSAAGLVEVPLRSERHLSSVRLDLFAGGAQPGVAARSRDLAARISRV